MNSPSYTPRSDLKEPGSESAYAGWRSSNYIQIGGTVVINVQRTREPRHRTAINWLYMWQLREQFSEKALLKRIGFDRATIRAAFTDPNFDVSPLVPVIEQLRAELDASLQEPADTVVHRKAKKALRFAIETKSIAEMIAKTREGKTMTADWFHLKNLHRAVYYSCKEDVSDRDFIWGLARAHGVSVGNGKTGSQIKDQIRSMYGRGGLELLIIDEGHNLWPVNIKDKPKRIDFLRGLWDANKDGIGEVVFSTPQSIISSNQAMVKCERWAPGQWEGRLVRFRTGDETPDGDFPKVARFHCPEGTEAMIKQLVLFTKISSGRFGSMVNVLKLARMNAGDDGKPLSAEYIKAAQMESIAGSPLEAELKKAGML